MNDVLISIIIPVYRVEPYIVNCLKSVVNQTYKNVEIIMIDDRGGDRSFEIGKEYLDSMGIKYKTIVNEKNSGPSFSRNEGLKVAEGKYIFFLDSDDCLDKYCLSYLVMVMESPDIDAELSFSDYKAFRNNDDICASSGELSVEKFEIRHDVDFVRKHGFVWGTLYRLDVIKENNIQMPVDISYMEDNIWNLDYLECIDRNKIYFVKSTHYNYFLNPQSLSRPGSKEIIVQKTLDCLNYYEERFYKMDDSTDRRKKSEVIEARRFFRSCFFNELYVIDRTIRSKKPKKYKGSLKHSINMILKSDIGFFDKICELAALIPFLERAVYKLKFVFFNK